MSEHQPVNPEPDLRELFATHHLRCTRQRRVLYGALMATDSHPTADHLFQELSRRDHSISLATVYNTLEAFCRAGLAQRIATPSGSARYDASVHNHLHIRDENSGVVADVPEDLGKRFLDAIPREVIQQLESHLDFDIRELKVELVGRYRPDMRQ
ncbi:MAG: transcriptional repressor [Planctomycetes bacterium]|nr:transcriptional repressor [Planctomycetota bacterium]